MGMHGPQLLKSNQFTPLTRTPWAGEALARGIKRRLAGNTARIGESWEISCDPQFQSLLKDRPGTLADFLRDDPRGCLSNRLVDTGILTCEILIKLINANEPLSLQVHPADGDPGLQVGEGGKPESWLVLDAAPGAAIYLGFSTPLGKADLARALKEGSFHEGLLQKVSVSPGDYFDISPGTVHAIGPGLVLFEPQRVRMGMSGKTWRLWDWNRRYDKNGHVDPKGQPRELHLVDGLRIVEPQEQCGPTFVKKLQRIPQIYTGKDSCIKEYPANPHYFVAAVEISPGGSVDITATGGYGCLTMTRGNCVVTSAAAPSVHCQLGDSAFLPASGFPLQCRNPSSDETSRLCLVFPAGTKVGYDL